MSCTPLAVTLGLPSVNAPQLPPVGVALPGKCIFFGGSGRMLDWSPLSRTPSLLIMVSRGGQRWERRERRCAPITLRETLGAASAISNKRTTSKPRHSHSFSDAPGRRQGYQTLGACRYETLGGVSSPPHLNAIKGKMGGGTWLYAAVRSRRDNIHCSFHQNKALHRISPVLFI